MFPMTHTEPWDDASDSLAAAFAVMQRALEQTPEWQSRPAAPTEKLRQVGRLTCAERTAIAKKAAAARWAKKTR
jgi:hypothetical protein